MFGFDPPPFKGQNPGGDGQGGNDGRGRGRGRGKGRGKGKGDGKATPAASGDEAPSAAAELQKLKSKQIACAGFQKGVCKKGDQCQFAHLDADAAAEIKRANAAWKKAEAATRSASSERTPQ